jgi:hypothetical protein
MHSLRMQEKRQFNSQEMLIFVSFDTQLTTFHRAVLARYLLTLTKGYGVRVHRVGKKYFTFTLKNKNHWSEHEKGMLTVLFGK